MSGVPLFLLFLGSLASIRLLYDAVQNLSEDSQILGEEEKWILPGTFFNFDAVVVLRE